jgi:hypothetical protein
MDNFCRNRKRKFDNYTIAEKQAMKGLCNKNLDPERRHPRESGDPVRTLIYPHE